MNIVIPMVGRGTRVPGCLPKPLVTVDGTTIIEHCVSSLKLEGQYVFVVRTFTEFPNGVELTESLIQLLKTLKPGCIVVRTETITEGPACSVLLTKEHIDNTEPLVVTNCDQHLNWDAKEFHEFVEVVDCDGCVTIYPFGEVKIGQPSPYSFISIPENGMYATRLEEKLAISKLTLNGIHYWQHGYDFVWSATKMIENDSNRVNGEFYVSKTYNELIKTGKKITAFRMNPWEFWALGSTEEIEQYERLKPRPTT